MRRILFEARRFSITSACYETSLALLWRNLESEPRDLKHIFRSDLIFTKASSKTLIMQNTNSLETSKSSHERLWLPQNVRCAVSQISNCGNEKNALVKLAVKEWCCCFSSSIRTNGDNATSIHPTEQWKLSNFAFKSVSDKTCFGFSHILGSFSFFLRILALRTVRRILLEALKFSSLPQRVSWKFTCVILEKILLGIERFEASFPIRSRFYEVSSVQ